MAEAEERSGGVVQARHVVTKGGLRLDVFGKRVGWVLLAVDVEKDDDFACNQFLQEADAPGNVGKAFDGGRIVRSHDSSLVVAPHPDCLVSKGPKGDESKNAGD